MPASSSGSTNGTSRTVELAPDEVVVRPKPVLSSKIIWWDVIAALLQIIDHIALNGEFIPQPMGAMIHSVVSIILRTYFSGTPLKGLIRSTAPPQS